MDAVQSKAPALRPSREQAQGQGVTPRDAYKQTNTPTDPASCCPQLTPCSPVRGALIKQGITTGRGGSTPDGGPRPRAGGTSGRTGPTVCAPTPLPAPRPYLICESAARRITGHGNPSPEQKKEKGSNGEDKRTYATGAVAERNHTRISYADEKLNTARLSCSNG